MSFKFAELYARLDVYKAAWIADRYYRGDTAFTIRDVATAGATAKCQAVNLAVETALEVMKCFGGASYFEETNKARVHLGRSPTT